MRSRRPTTRGESSRCSNAVSCWQMPSCSRAERRRSSSARHTERASCLNAARRVQLAKGALLLAKTHELLAHTRRLPPKPGHFSSLIRNRHIET